MTDKRHLVREHSAAKVSSILNTSCPLSSNCLMGSNMVRSGGHKGGHGARARRRNIRTIRAIHLQGARVSAATKAPAHSCLNHTSPQETGTTTTSASPAVTTPAVTVTIPPVPQQDSHTEADEAPALTESEAATLPNHASPGPPSLPHKRLNLTLHSRGGGEGESDAGREGLTAGTVPAAPARGGGGWDGACRA
jgi:hypothetical protein